MAKLRNVYSKEDSVYSDPLSDCTGDFNILQFLDDNDTSLDSPVDSRVPPYQTRNSNTVPDPIDDMMFPNTTRLPESPPTTDISAAGSSGSPSSASDSPYSPHTYHNYQVLHNTTHNGLVGVGENEMMRQDLLQGNRMLTHTLPSPQSGAYTAQSTPAPLSQPSMNNGYLVDRNAYQVDPYQAMLNSSEDSVASSDGISRKRMRAENIKNEHNMYALPSPAVEEMDEGCHQQAIKFTRFNEEQWTPLFDMSQRALHQLEMHVVADKGFNLSHMDGCFVNQKKNHFQISVHIEAIDNHPPHLVKVGTELKHVTEFKLAFCGVKSELPSSEIQIKQSTTDRRPVPHDPVSLEIHERRMTKVTVPRLHFSETTMNNQRKNGRPNPDQKYFLLVVRLIACTADGSHPVVQAYQSEKVIVRASNPGQFEPPDSEVAWQKNGSTLFYNNGSVAIGMDRAMAPLTVGGDIYCSGVLHRPSDRRVKEDIHEVDSKDAMSRLAQIRVVGYSYKPEIAVQWGLSEENRHRVGVIAQELAQILPDAVTDNGDFLQVDDSRIFYETVAAATELCRLTGNLEHKIEAVEKLSHKLARLHRRRHTSMASGLSEVGFMSSTTSLTSSFSSTSGQTTTAKEEKRDRHCDASCHRNEPQLCSSKLTQGTIVTLVVVMAVCLIAMSTLYVLDWHSRTFGYQPHVYMSTTAPAHKGNMGNIVQLKEHSWIPPSQPSAIALGVCESNTCHTYCCTNTNTNTNTPPIQQQMLSLSQQPSLVLPHRHVEQASISSFSPLHSGLSIQVLTANITLDQRYCTDHSCESKRGLYTLYVPISPAMPAIPIEIHIETYDNANYIDNCGCVRDFEHKACAVHEPLHKPPSSRKITSQVYELSIGNYKQSAFRFRVGYSTESCHMSESQRGRSFDEYNIIFYRQCTL